MTREEELRLCWLARDGDVDAKNQVIMNLYPLIRMKARQIGLRWHKPINDLAQSGMVKLIENFHRYDPATGYRASTYFLWFITRHMWEVAVNKENVITTPREWKCGVEAEWLPEDRLHYTPTLPFDRDAFYGPIRRLRIRERLLVFMKMDGLSNREIGLEIGVTKSRVQSLLQQVYATLGAEYESKGLAS